MDNILYSWNSYFNLVKKLAGIIEKEIVLTKDTVLFAVGRGGLIPATMLSYIFNDMPLRVIMVESYYKGQTSKELRFYQKPLATGVRTFDKIIVVDDICDSGKTLQEIYTWLTRSYYNVTSDEIEFATVVTKNCVDFKQEPFNKLLYAEMLDCKKWVVFPYEDFA